jgi:hypothetical protein
MAVDFDGLPGSRLLQIVPNAYQKFVIHNHTAEVFSLGNIVSNELPCLPVKIPKRHHGYAPDLRIGNRVMNEKVPSSWGSTGATKEKRR